VQNFTHQQVTEVRNQLLAIDKELVSASLDKTSPRLQELKREVVLIGNTFLRLEKFVNMNFTGFYKVRAAHCSNSSSNYKCCVALQRYLQPLHDRFIASCITGVVI
jgi:SPX domain protein involved in polyphosphate accumulation